MSAQSPTTGHALGMSTFDVLVQSRKRGRFTALFVTRAFDPWQAKGKAEAFGHLAHYGTHVRVKARKHSQSCGCEMCVGARGPVH